MGLLAGWWLLGSGVGMYFADFLILADGRSYPEYARLTWGSWNQLLQDIFPNLCRCLRVVSRWYGPWLKNRGCCAFLKTGCRFSLPGHGIRVTWVTCKKKARNFASLSSYRCQCGRCPPAKNNNHACFSHGYL